MRMWTRAFEQSVGCCAGREGVNAMGASVWARGADLTVVLCASPSRSNR